MLGNSDWKSTGLCRAQVEIYPPYHLLYAYYATAANLDTLYPPVKILALKISINIRNT